MSCTRTETLIALRHWGQPVSPAVLASWMRKSAASVRDNLQSLYAMDLCDRSPNPEYPHRYLYRCKQVVA